jgi:DNA-binding HxlR family transcriptional regulator
MSGRTLIIGDSRPKPPERRPQRQIFGGDDPKQLKAKLRVLSKKYTWEILADLTDGKKNLTQIAADNGIPYTTVQNRVVEMEKLNLISVHDETDPHSKRPVKMIRVEDFVLEVTHSKIVEMVRGGRS